MAEPLLISAAVAILALTGACSVGNTVTGASSSPPTATPSSAPTSTAPTRRPPSATTTPMRLTMTPARARTDTGELLDGDCFADHAQTSAPDPEDCSFGFFDGETVVLYGDTHAAQWFSAAVEVAARHDWRLLPVTKADCPPGGERVLSTDLRTEYPECAAWHAHVMDLIEAQEPILVLVAARADHYRIAGGDDGEPLSAAESAARLSSALADDLRRFADMGARTVLIRDTQVPGFDVPGCIEAAGPGACGYRLPESTPEDAAQRAAARGAGTPVVDLRSEVCGDRSDCHTVIDGLITFRDAEHLTSTFAGSLAGELEAGIEALRA